MQNQQIALGDYLKRLRSTISSRPAELQSRSLERGQHRGRQDYSLLFLRTMRYSLRRALSLDSVDGGTRNPTVGISIRGFFQAELTSGNGSNHLPFGACQRP